MKRCYLVQEICWDEAGRTFPCKVFLDKKKAQKYVDKLNNKVEFNEGGEAMHNEEFNAALSWEVVKLPLV